MTVPQFSAVIAVHAGTVHRWEAAGAAPVPVDGIAANLLAALDQKIQREGVVSFRPSEVGEQVVQALLVGGALLALGLLIELLLKGGRR